MNFLQVAVMLELLFSRTPILFDVSARNFKGILSHTFSIEFVFACHASSDPNDLVLDLVSKFSVDFRFIQEVSYLVELPEKTFRHKQPFIAYTVKVTNVLQDTFNLHWYCRTTSSYEALIPKVIAEIPDIQELLKDDQGPLTCKSIKRNGCCEILNSGNSLFILL